MAGEARTAAAGRKPSRVGAGCWQPSGGDRSQLEFSVRTACAQSAVETVRFRLLQGDTQYMKTFHRASLGSLPTAAGAAILLTIPLAVPAYATSDLNTVIDWVRNWVAGLLAEPATLFLTIGGAR